MRLVLQRVHRAAVTVDGEVAGSIDRGLMALVGVGHDSTDADATWLAAKVEALRVFADAAGAINTSVVDVGGGVLAISQFTLYGDLRKGRRPSFVAAAPPAEAERLYDLFCDSLTVGVGRGVFGAHMDIDMVCDGPVTLTLQSEGRQRVLDPRRLGAGAPADAMLRRAEGAGRVPALWRGSPPDRAPAC